MSNLTIPKLLRIEDAHGDATYIRFDCIESIKPIYDLTVNTLVGIQLKTVGQRIYQLMNGKPGDTEAIEIVRQYVKNGLLDGDIDKPLFPKSTSNPEALKEMEKLKNQKNTAETTVEQKLKLLQKDEAKGIN